MARRGEGIDEILEGLWAMGAILAMVTTIGTGVALFVIAAPLSSDLVLVGPGLVVPFLLAAIAAVSLFASSTTLFADPGPQSGGPTAT